MDNYYEGQHPLLFSCPEFMRTFGSQLTGFSDNWCGSVVDATEERLTPTGFRFGPGSDEDVAAWDIWQANGLDSESQMAHTEALTLSECYALVWPAGDGDAPRITIEHPTQVIAETSAADRRVVIAALKWYVDDDRYSVAYLYLPGTVYRWRSSSQHPENHTLSSGTAWVPEDRDDAEDPAEQPNPFGEVVPIVPLRNRPRLVRPPRSEIAPVIPLQNAVNKLFADLLVGSEYTADAQRYLLGWEPDIDPETGEMQPIPWNRRDRLWFVPPTEDDQHAPQFGQFNAGDLSGYLKSIEMVINHIASITRTPPHYLSPSADRLSGESIKSSESGLVSKVRRKQTVFGEAWEQIMRLAFILDTANKEKARFVRAETVWADPEIRSEGELTDSVVKKRQGLNVPLEQCWEDLGYSPTQIGRMKADLAAEGLDLSGSNDAEVARQVGEILQKGYLAVESGIISKEELRDLANRAGGNFTGPAPVADAA